jgi:hypothetical protein
MTKKVPESAAAKRRQQRASKRREKTIRTRVRGLYYPTGVTPDDFFDAIGKLRKEAHDEIDRLLSFLDDLDDAEPEADADFEPALGSAISGYGSDAYDQEEWGHSDDADEREGSDPDLEPSLGWSTTRAYGAGDDREDEHDGGEPDDDGEPLLGATLAFNQDDAWRMPDRVEGTAYEPEADPLDDGEYDPSESGIGDSDGVLEQWGFSGSGIGSSGFCSHVE